MPALPHRIGPKGLALIKSFESFVGYPYDDKVPSKNGKYPEWRGGPVRGTLTIGYGHTDAAIHPLKIKPGIYISEPIACDILDVDLDAVESDVNRMVKVPLTQGQFDSCVSFCFNCGAGNFKNIAARLNRGEYSAAWSALALYNKSGGEVMRGLTRRRAAEQMLWNDDDYELPTAPVDHPADVDEERAEAPKPAPKLAPAPKPSPVTPGKVATGLGGALLIGAGLFLDKVEAFFKSLF